MRVKDRKGRREIRHNRSGLKGTAERPRLAVYRSLRHIYAQIVDDTQGKTLANVSSLSPEIRESIGHGGNKKAAVAVGTLLAKRAVALGIKKVCFDRGGFLYHGCVAAIADAARKEGLEF